MLLPFVKPTCICTFLKAKLHTNLQIKFMMYTLFQYAKVVCVHASSKVSLRTNL